MQRAFALVCVGTLAWSGCGDDGSTENGTGTSTGSTQATDDTAGDDNGTSVGGDTESSTAPADDTAADTAGDSTAGSSESSAGDSTGEVLDECEMCLADECVDAVTACVEDVACDCWIDCLDLNEEDACVEMCGETPETLEDVFECVSAECGPECGIPGELFDPCTKDSDCETSGGCGPFINYCGQACTDEKMCPMHPDSDATPSCAPSLGPDGQCLLSCANGETCPSGMSCVSSGGGAPICAFE